MRAEKKPAWLRWLMLAAALGLCWTIWDEVAEFFRLEQAGIFSPELWEPIRAETRLGWAVRGLAAAVFLYQFAVWSRARDSVRAALGDGIFLSLLTILWGGLLYWFLPLDGLGMAFWVLLLFLQAGGAVLSWRRFYKRNTQNVTINHEEEVRDER